MSNIEGELNLDECLDTVLSRSFSDIIYDRDCGIFPGFLDGRVIINENKIVGVIFNRRIYTLTWTHQ